MANQIGKFFILIVAFHVLAIVACDPLGTDCGGFTQSFYEVTDLKLVNLRIDGSTIPDTEIQLDDSAYVQLDDYRLAFETEVEYFTDNTPAFSNPFISSAWACSPPYPEAAEIITKIEITNISDLVTFEGDTLKAGTILNDFFRSYQKNSTLTELIDTGTLAPTDEGIPSQKLALKAIPLDFLQPHQFSVVYELDSGNIFTATSPIIYFHF